MQIAFSFIISFSCEHVVREKKREIWEGRRTAGSADGVDELNLDFCIMA